MLWCHWLGGERGKFHWSVHLCLTVGARVGDLVLLLEVFLDVKFSQKSGLKLAATLTCTKI